MPRIRIPRASAWMAAAGVTLAVVALAGCASTAAAGDDPADPAFIAERANAAGVAPELVFTTEVEGYDLAPQSFGPTPAGGMAATWFDLDTGAMLTIRTDHEALTAESCAATPLWMGSEGPVTCAEEDGIWHRSSSDVHEYVAMPDGATIWVTGANGAPPDDLLAAAKAVRVPSEEELALLFSDAPDASAVPVERGDLPQHGDGAPIDPTGPGG